MIRIPVRGSRTPAVVDQSDAGLARYRWTLTPKGYARRGDGKTMHRLVARAPKGVSVDHRNGIRLDNRRANLRFASNAQNHRNRRVASGSVPYKGVDFHKKTGKFRARVRVPASSGQGVLKHLGLFDDSAEAAMVYDAYASRLYGAFAATNRSLGLL